MRKITSILTLLLLAFCSIGASAQLTTLTLVDGTNAPFDTYTTRSNGNLTLTSNGSSGIAGLTVVLESGQFDRHSSWYDVYSLVMKPGTAQTATKVTITAPEGYVVSDYNITLQAVGTAAPYLVSTTEDESDITTNGTSVTHTSAVNFSKNNIFKNSTNFTIYQNSSSINWLLAKSFTVTLIKKQTYTEIVESGCYYIANMVGGYLDGSTGSYAWKTSSQLSSVVGLWYIENRGEGEDGNVKYYISEFSNSKYFGGLGPEANMNANAADQRITLREDGAYYTLSGHANNTVGITNYSAIHYNGTSGNLLYRNGGDISGTTFETQSQWQLIKATDAYRVTFTSSDNSVSSIYVDGKEIAIGSTICLTAATTVSSHSLYNNATYNNFSTLAEALADENFDGTVDVVKAGYPDITVNIVDESNTTLKTVTYEAVPEGTTIDLTAANLVDNNFVTLSPSTVTGTAEDQTITITPTYTLPFTPSTVASPVWYSMRIAIGNSPGYFYNNSGTAQCNPDNSLPTYSADQYAWAFIGNPITGFKIYSKGAEQYLGGRTASGGEITFVDEENAVLFIPEYTSSRPFVWKSITYGYYMDRASGKPYAHTAGQTNEFARIYDEVTVNVMYDEDVVKAITIPLVPQNTSLDGTTLASFAGTNYTTYNAVTASSETVSTTYTSNFPFTVSSDPTDAENATAYLLTLNQKYAHGTTLVSPWDGTENDYLWTFGGDELRGVTVYNQTNGYMNVSEGDHSTVTFSASPTTYSISPNGNQTDGFNLYLPNTISYINDFSNNGVVSTWNNANAGSTEYGSGSCLKVYTTNEAALDLLNSLEPYFTYAGCVNALTTSAASELSGSYATLKGSPTYAGYAALKSTIEGNLVQPQSGFYYQIICADNKFYTSQGVNKAMYYDTSDAKVKWTTLDDNSATQVLKLTAADDNKFRIYSPLADVYLQTKTGETTSDETNGLAVEVTNISPAVVALVYNPDGGDDAALHTQGHNEGEGVSGNLTNWYSSDLHSHWHLKPVDVPEITLIAPNGVSDNEEVFQSFAYNSNKQLPLNVEVIYISSETTGTAHIETVSSSAIKAGVGYIIKGIKGATVPLLPISEVADLEEDNLLTGVTDETTVYSGYILAYKGSDGEPKFYKISSSGLTIPAYRSYLGAAESGSVRGLELLFGGLGDDITGIEGISTDGSESAIFDLQGRRVIKPEKGGIYIINGKKIMK